MKPIWSTTTLACLLVFAAALSPGLSIAAEQPAGDRAYIILCTGNNIPPGLADGITGAGGVVTGTIPEIGVLLSTSAASDFAAKASKLEGVRSVIPDFEAQWTVPPVEGTSVPVFEASIGNAETFFGYQWGPVAIHAPEAWDAGARGTGVRVAIVDGGISSNHLDIAPNLDVAASASFVPGYPFNYDTGTFWHATHVAGIVAASANARGTIGVAPGATLVGVKALHGGSAPFSRINAAIVYAASQAQLINLSIGTSLPRRGFWNTAGNYWVSARDISELIVATQRALNYAHAAGATIIASAGNGAMDCDHNADIFVIPAQLEHVIAVSATGPVNFAGGGTNFDDPASYTNYGQSLVALAAPGGDYQLYPNGLWYLDMVFSSSYASPPYSYYSWAAGTSMAAPHAVGVAALILEANGGPMEPAQVEAILRASADDLGKPGRDDYYGLGRVNAYAAVVAARAKNGMAKAATDPEASLVANMPVSTRLYENFPNPFNPTTEIRFDIAGPPAGNSAGDPVKLVVYDLLGREVAVLVNEPRAPGRYSVRFDAKGLSSGVYVFRLESGNLVQARRMVLVK